MSLDLGDVSVGADADATRECWQRKMFRNPRGLLRYYIFYRKNVGGVDTIYYGWDDNGYSWAGGNVDIQAMTTLSVRHPVAIFVEDAANFRTIVYVAAQLVTGEVRIRQGTIADAASLIVWDGAGEQQLYANTYEGGSGFNIGLDPNYYLWAYAVTTGGGFKRVYTKASTAIRPTGGLAWTTETLVVQNVLAATYLNFNIVGYDPASPHVCLAGFNDQAASFYFLTYGNPPTLNESAGYTFVTYNNRHVGSASVDSDGYVHLVWNFGGNILHKSRLYNFGGWWGGAPSIVYNGADVDGGPYLTMDTGLTPNKIYVFYEHGTGIIEYKTSPADAISWSSASEIEDHAEDVKWLIGWFTDDVGIPRSIIGGFTTQTTDTVRTFVLTLGIPAGQAITRVKAKGWPKRNRGKTLFLDGDTFVGQDLGRWAFDPDDTGFSWLTQGEVTIPADRAMNSVHTYAFAMLVATVQSPDMSDAKIGFYTDANHYAWIDQDSLRTRNGITAELPTDISASLPNDTRLKIVLIWTPFYVRLIIIDIVARTRTVFEQANPPHIEGNVTFQVIVGGSDLLVEDYSVYDVENDVMYALGILPYDPVTDTLSVDVAALPLPAGAATQATLAALNAKILTDTDDNSIIDGQTVQLVIPITQIYDPDGAVWRRLQAITSERDV